MLTLGTRGDVQPYVALALELGKAGHEAVLAAPEMFEAFVTGHGVAFAALDDGPMRLMDTSGVREAMEGGVWARVALARQLPKLFGGLLEDAWAVASGGGRRGGRGGPQRPGPRRPARVAEKLRVPTVLASPIPMYVPTRQFPWPGQSLPARLPAPMNRITFVGMKAASLAFGCTVDAWRQRTLGLPRRRGRHDDPLLRPDGGPAPVLHAFSPRVLPPPSDWPRTVTTTGYWFLPPETGASARTEASGGSLPDGLADFLGAGEPPCSSASAVWPAGTRRGPPP